MILISAEKEEGEDTGIYDCIPLNCPNEQKTTLAADINQC